MPQPYRTTACMRQLSADRLLLFVVFNLGGPLAIPLFSLTVFQIGLSPAL